MIHENDILQVTISDVGMAGEGIAHQQDSTIFVPYALQGEDVLVKVVHVKRGLVYARLLEVLLPSPHRVTPRCSKFVKCGGCALQMADYEYQLDYKTKHLMRTLAKAGIDTPVSPCIASPRTWGYRNKVSLPFGIVDGQVSLGMFAEGTHRLVRISRCHLNDEWIATLIRTVTDWARTYRISVYRSDTGEGLLRHLVARYVDDKMVVALVINGRKLPHHAHLISALQAEFSALSLYLNTNTRHNNVIFGAETVCLLDGDAQISINGIATHIHPLSFLQVNDAVRESIYQRVVDMVPAGGIVVDAFAGVGVLGAVLAQQGSTVYNIEIVSEATGDADDLAEANGIAHLVTNICGDSGVELPRLLDTMLRQSTPTTSREHHGITVLLDPPRKGCPDGVIDALLQSASPQADSLLYIDEHASAYPYVENLIYISCNPATLARDLARLSTAYTILDIQPYDMFPQCAHVETLVRLARK